jgi:2-polyprenyl-3-methyl-5-hydroxy-6-metoxy-1,4-benzoquinol methylase
MTIRHGSDLARKQNEEMGRRILEDGCDSALTQKKIKLIAGIISSLPRKESLADVGCFDGKFFGAYKSCGVSSIDGFDMIPGALEIAKTRADGVSTYLWDMEVEAAPVPGATYDVIVCSDVIEHVFNTKNLVSECYRILKPSGVCLFLTPNLVSLWNRCNSLRGRMPLGHSGVSAEHKTEQQVNLAHVRMGTAKEWAGLFQSVGFKITTVEGIWSGARSRVLSFGRATLAHTLVIECTK